MNGRLRLPNRRRHEVSEFTHRRVAFTLGVGFFADGGPAEIFISAPQIVGSETEAIARDGAILASLCLQYGANIETLARALTRNHDGTAATAIGAALDTLLAREVSA